MSALQWSSPPPSREKAGEGSEVWGDTSWPANAGCGLIIASPRNKSLPRSYNGPGRWDLSQIILERLRLTYYLVSEVIRIWMVVLSWQPWLRPSTWRYRKIRRLTAVKESKINKSFHQKIKINELDVLYCRCDYCGLLTAVFLLLPAELRGILNAKICDQPAFV